MPQADAKSTYDQRYQQVGQQINVAGDYIEGEQAYDVRGLTNPYLGLQAFTYAERDRYAGREEDVGRALASLTRPGDELPLLFVTGASGSGKSSFAQAGLLPAPEKHHRQQEFTVKWAIFRPGERPLAGLAAALRTLGVAADGVFAPAAEYQLAPPPRPADPNQISILIIDQFEELFIQAETGQRSAIFAILAALPPLRASRLHIIATMRADYLPDLFEHKMLYDIAKAGADLRVMSEDQLRAAIQRLLQVVHPGAGKRFQDALLNKLAQDAAKDAAYLPLLQVTLEDLWRTGLLTVDHYGDLTDAIRKRADEIYTSKRDTDGNLQPRLPQERESLLKIFLDLVDVSADDKVQRDVRRTRRLEDVTRGSRDTERLIQELATARLLTTGERELGDGGQQIETTVDIIHESLLLNWSLLSQAIQAQREYLRQRGRFELRLSTWLENHRPANRLLQGVDLAEAENLQRLDDVAIQSQDAEDLITRSVQERDRIRRRNQQVTAIVAAVLGVLLIAALVAFRQAVTNARLAQAQLDRQSGLAFLQEAYTLKEKGDAQGAIEKFHATKATKTDLGIDVETEIEDVRRQVATRLVQDGEALAKGGDFPAAEAKFKAALALDPPPDTPVYVYVPAGEFVMGAGAEDDRRASQFGWDNAAEHQKDPVTLDDYWIQRTEVTNAQYLRCVEAGEAGEADGCKPPVDGNVRYRDPQFAKQPVSGVTWYQARDYAAWAGGRLGRLPTEAEWEKACRGGLEIPQDPLVGWGQTKGNEQVDRPYPWGKQDPTGELLNFSETGLGTWSAVGSYPKGASPYGARDMAGNVWEWTSSAYVDYPYTPKKDPEDPEPGEWRVLRGGSFGDDANGVRCAYRFYSSSDYWGVDGGFRVVVSPGF